ncbi:MAG: phosphodiesterase YaeI [Spartobacteria bacterium]|nr:phosphodiesterase YaeI [Spartobacteria bacterium]
MITRRQFILGGAATLGLGVFVDMRVIEPRWLGVDHRTIHLPGVDLERPIRILHLADMHLSDTVSLSFIRRAFLKGLAYRPDLICLTGDFISTRIKNPEAYVATLRLLSDRAPCFACPGNHDGGDWVKSHGGYNDLTVFRALLHAADITLLVNQWETVSIKGQPIRLVALGDLWAMEARPKTAFKNVPPNSRTPCILLSHNPDSKDICADYPWDLMLCGHTHGGQLKLPLLGTPFAPVRDHRFVAGLHPWSNRLIYTTRGIGNIFGLRFNCRPEVSILDISA